MTGLPAYLRSMAIASPIAVVEQSGGWLVCSDVLVTVDVAHRVRVARSRAEGQSPEAEQGASVDAKALRCHAPHSSGGQSDPPTS